MRVLDITTVRTGSTGGIATDIKKYFLENNDEYIIAFSEKDSKPLNGDILIGNKLDHKLHALLSRIFGLQGYFSFISTFKFLRKVKTYKPDIVVLGNLHSNYINLPLLFSYLAKEKINVVMILHDCWFFTGKCTHFTVYNCNKWRERCHSCHCVTNSNNSWFFDQSKKMFLDRDKWYNSLTSLTIVAVSDWEANLARQSPLFKKASIRKIYNWIDTNIFKPATDDEITRVQKKYGLRKDLKYVISVGAMWANSSSKTSDAIRFASQLQDDYRLIIVGKSHEGTFPSPIITIPYTSNANELAVLYSMSNAYIHFSVEDTFGKVIAEAMACGVVPIVFNSTACGEVAGPYGVAVAPHDINAMISALDIASDLNRRRAVRQYAIANYSKDFNLKLYHTLYNNIVFNEKN